MMWCLVTQNHSILKTSIIFIVIKVFTIHFSTYLSYLKLVHFTSRLKSMLHLYTIILLFLYIYLWTKFIASLWLKIQTVYIIFKYFQYLSYLNFRRGDSWVDYKKENRKGQSASCLAFLSLSVSVGCLLVFSVSCQKLQIFMIIQVR